MTRAYLSLQAASIAAFTDADLLGRLAAKLPFALEPAQRTAWEYQIQHLRELAAALPDAHAFLEFLIPRMGRRADLILLVGGIVFVIEYKLNAAQYDRSSLDQVYGYGLDLKHFHETSHRLPIVPILVATHAGRNDSRAVQWDDDGLAKPLGVNAAGLLPTIQSVCGAHKR